MNRRTLLKALPGLLFLGWLRPDEDRSWIGHELPAEVWTSPEFGEVERRVLKDGHVVTIHLPSGEWVIEDMDCAEDARCAG